MNLSIIPQQINLNRPAILNALLHSQPNSSGMTDSEVMNRSVKSAAVPQSNTSRVLGSSSLMQSAQSVIRNISDLGDSARQQRLEDQRQGLSVWQGAKQFSKQVGDLYGFIANGASFGANATQIENSNSLDRVGELAKEYLQKQAGQQIFPALNSFSPRPRRACLISWLREIQLTLWVQL